MAVAGRGFRCLRHILPFSTLAVVSAVRLR